MQQIPQTKAGLEAYIAKTQKAIAAYEKLAQVSKKDKTSAHYVKTVARKKRNLKLAQGNLKELRSEG